MGLYHYFARCALRAHLHGLHLAHLCCYCCLWCCYSQCIGLFLWYFHHIPCFLNFEAPLVEFLHYMTHLLAHHHDNPRGNNSTRGAHEDHGGAHAMRAQNIDDIDPYQLELDENINEIMRQQPNMPKYQQIAPPLHQIAPLLRSTHLYCRATMKMKSPGMMNQYLSHQEEQQGFPNQPPSSNPPLKGNPMMRPTISLPKSIQKKQCCMNQKKLRY